MIISFLFSEWSLQLWFTKLKLYLITYLSSQWTCLSASFKKSFQIDWLKHIWLPIMIYKILINSANSMNNQIEVIIMWHLTLLTVKDILSKLIRKSLLCLLLASVLLSHQNLFSMTLLTINFIKLLFQHILMNVEDVVSQAILIKTAQSLRLIN